MPTLRPQKLSGLVVIPTVESGGGLHRVSLAIDVGASRTGAGIPPLEVVNREDLVVVLRHPVEGSFEPIASPDPGPLPVRALRVVQARGEFTYGQGQNAPTELRVTLRGDTKTFAMAQTFTPAGGCVGTEPDQGDPFPAPRSRPGPLHIPIGLLQRIPPLRPLIGPRCCLGRFDAPVNAIADAAVKSESFEVEADFSQRGRRCRCACCEYRQLVRGTFTDADGAAVRFDLPSGALSPVAWCEDGAIDEFGPGAHGYYGHRDTSSGGDAYAGKGPGRGCTYRGNSTPSCPPPESMHLEYVGLVVDRCRGRVTAARTWTVDL